MELNSEEWNLLKDHEKAVSDSNNHLEVNKHKHSDEAETVAFKRQKLSDDNENLECLRNICEAGLEEEEETKVQSTSPVDTSEMKPDVSVLKKKKKKKKIPPNSAPKPKVVPVKNEKSKAHMRKNIRDILKGDELEAETRAAQQREIERVQRLQQQQQSQHHQIAENNHIPIFSDEETSTPACSSLVEDLQALARELEDSTLSPDIPLEFIENNQHFNHTSSSHSTDSVKIKDENPPKIVQKPEYDDVICLSSDDEEFPPKPVVPSLPPRSKQYLQDDDDDDVVILSGDDEKPEIIDEEESDVHNFGLHTRDELNRPDNEGRVLVNVGHPQNESDIFLAPQLARAAKPHQIGGIRFLYDNVVESLEQFSTSMGFGCILAHSMGLGKTFQVCAFSEVFLRHTKAKTVLIIVPINTIQNWVAEFNSWLPSEVNSDRSPNDPQIQPRSFGLHVLNDSTKDLNSRSRVINDWVNQGGVLLIGYEMYRLFYTLREGKEKKRNMKKKKATGFVDIEEEEKDKAQIERIYQALVSPGPELIICDEGHRIKNMKTSISVALKEVRTRRRIVLTGYPLQNNLLEYWCMVDFVRPNFLGTRIEFGNMFERPIQNGQCVDSNPADVKLMKERVYVLHSLVKGFVQRRSHAVLRSSLPHKEEYVLLLRMTPLQRALYRHFMSQLLLNKSVSNPLKAFAVCLKIWNHPDVLYNFFKKGKDDLDLELEEEAAAECRKKKKNLPVSFVPLPSPSVPAAAPSNDAEGADVGESSLQGGSIFGQGAGDSAKDKKEDSTSLDWANELLKGYIPGDIENAAKTQIFFTILEESVSIGDRLLVFSQSLFTLNMLEEFLQQRPIPNRGDETWSKNRSYFRLDGSTTGMEREKLVNEFNANPDVLLFLISTRAGSLGINLIGANRVIVFDASWNPCHDAQAVCRVYRYGQQKPCFIYRLVIDNSLEKKIYDRQIGKQGTADRVVDELNPEARLSLKDVTSLVCDDEDDPPPKDYGANMGRQLNLADQILGSVLQRWGSSFTKDPFQHDALLTEGKDSKLSKAEKRMAQRLYEKAKLDGSMQYRRQNYSSYYPKSSLPIPTIDNHNGAYNRVMNPMYTPIRPLQGLPSKSSIDPHAQGMGVDLLAEALAQGKLVCKEMVLTKDVTIARSQMTGAGSGSNDTTPVVLPSGTRVKLIKTPKGIYMQTPEGKIFRIHSSAPATPASPSTIAAALGMNMKTPYPYSSSQGPSGELASFSGGSKSSMEQTVLRRIREMQHKSSSGDDSKQVISFNDKNTLLAQIRQNLSAGKGIGNNVRSSSGQLLESSPRSSLSGNANLSHFAKQLANLAQKSASDSSTEVGVGPSDIESNGSSSNSGLSPIRPSSSLLDPKARALPSASLPKKVATVTPNLSRARSFSSNRPTAPVEPIQKHSLARQSAVADIPSIPNSVCSPPPALSALSALSALTLPSTTKAVDFTRPSKLSPNLGELVSRNEVQHQPTSSTDSNGSTASGLFDNLSLASQLEGFASSTSTTAKPSAESLKDLLKTTSNAAGENPGSTNYGTEWNGGQAASGNSASWPEYPQWNNAEWNGASTSNNSSSSSSQSNWQWSQQQQLANPPIHSNFTSLAGSNIGQTPTATNPSQNQIDPYNISHQYSNTFDVNNQWLNYSSASNSANPGNATTYPSHSLAPIGHLTSPAYYSTPYFGSNPSTYTSYPPPSQPGFAGVNTNYHNQYGSHVSSDFAPNYSQPYPGSFSQ